MATQYKLFLSSRFLLVILVLLTGLLPKPASSWSGGDVPSFDDFVASVANGKSADWRGIYVPGVLAEEIVAQPANDPTFISSDPNTATVFRMASKHGSTGLLAHNTLAGQDFYLLEVGQMIYLINGNGKLQEFVITELLRYQALEPQSITSDFVDLQTGEKVSASVLFLRIFDRPGDLILQTCIYAGGDNSWGRLFVIAEPFAKPDVWSMPKITMSRTY